MNDFKHCSVSRYIQSVLIPAKVYVMWVFLQHQFCPIVSKDAKMGGGGESSNFDRSAIR